ncbi:hypothetical protein ES705_45795 [subsurface metagenome]
MNKSKARYDKRVKVTRILLSDYLALKLISQAAGISMPEALHRLIEHQAQLPLMDRLVRPMSAIATQPKPSIAAQLPVTTDIKAGLRVSPIIKLRVTVAGKGSNNGA